MDLPTAFPPYIFTPLTDLDPEPLALFNDVLRLQVSALSLLLFRTKQMFGLAIEERLSVDTRTPEEKDALLAWADKFCREHPHIPREEIARRKKEREEEREKDKAITAAKMAEYMRSMTEQIASLAGTIQLLAAQHPVPSNVTVPSSFLSTCVQPILPLQAVVASGSGTIGTGDDTVPVTSTAADEPQGNTSESSEST
ncbi:hypothetical protein EV361DRAFT_956731 [Lentinula raphanica]|nr:hypothetical protein EV361DRAFT_956731 [Lentinula raphanica]